LPSVSKDTLGPFAFVLLFSFQGSCSSFSPTKAARYECRDEQANLTQPKYSVNVFLCSFLFLIQADSRQDSYCPKAVFVCLKEAANYFIAPLPSRGKWSPTSTYLRIFCSVIWLVRLMACCSD
jgi:hypothetical protein